MLLFEPSDLKSLLRLLLSPRVLLHATCVFVVGIKMQHNSGEHKVTGKR